MNRTPRPHLETIRLARALGAYAHTVAANTNEALFLIHAALLAAFSAPGRMAPSTRGSLRDEIARCADLARTDASAAVL
jgi:hypothetical protein